MLEAARLQHYVPTEQVLVVAPRFTETKDSPEPHWFTWNGPCPWAHASTRTLGRRTAAIALLPTPHPHPTWFLRVKH